ncbi:MAG: hypothetical protein GY801_32605 [bacterium]|nr:hypothetical protein [bacterium]
MVVNPGDLVLGDDDGMVIIPQVRIGEVLEASRKRVAKEIDKAAALCTGKTSMELNNLHTIIESLGLVEESSYGRECAGDSPLYGSQRKGRPGGGFSPSSTPRSAAGYYGGLPVYPSGVCQKTGTVCRTAQCALWL